MELCNSQGLLKFCLFCFPRLSQGRLALQCQSVPATFGQLACGEDCVCSLQREGSCCTRRGDKLDLRKTNAMLLRRQLRRQRQVFRLRRRIRAKGGPFIEPKTGPPKVKACSWRPFFSALDLVPQCGPKSGSIFELSCGSAFLFAGGSALR